MRKKSTGQLGSDTRVFAAGEGGMGRRMNDILTDAVRPAKKSKIGRRGADDAQPSNAANADGGDQLCADTRGKDVSPVPNNSEIGDHKCDAIQKSFVAKFEGADQSRCDTQLRYVSAPDPSIAEVRELNRLRNDLHRAEKSLTLQIKAICRRFSDGDKKAAEKLYKAMNPDVTAWCAPLLAARGTAEDGRKDAEKRLKKSARNLPCYGFVKETRGLADVSYAQIIGEAGDLTKYSNPAKLWKRMGLAVIDGGRQRKVAGDAAIIHGYSPQRRSVMFIIGENLIRAKNPEYRRLYIERRAHTAVTHPDWTKGHSHNDAKRYIEKRLLRELWKAWRAANRSAQPICVLPPANQSAVAEG